MGMLDRDYFVETTLKRLGILEPHETLGRPRRKRQPAWRVWLRIRWLWLVAAIYAISALLAWVVFDMKHRGVPFTLHGLRWWLSLWLPS